MLVLLGDVGGTLVTKPETHSRRKVKVAGGCVVGQVVVPVIQIICDAFMALSWVMVGTGV